MQDWLRACRRGHFASTWLLLGCAALGATAPVAAAEAGRRLYEDKGCYQCHGYGGQGGFAGPRIGPEPLPWEAFAAIVRQPPSLMPAYPPRLLSDAELRSIYDHVTALPAPAPAPEIRSLLGIEAPP